MRVASCGRRAEQSGGDLDQASPAISHAPSPISDILHDVACPLLVIVLVLDALLAQFLLRIASLNGSDILGQ